MRHLALLSFTLAGCLVGPNEGVHSATVYDAAAAGAMTTKEVVEKPEDEVVLGWGLEIAGDGAKLRVCRSEDSCGTQVVEVPAKSLASVKTVARARPVGGDGAQLDEVDVLRVTVTRERRTSRGGIASDPAHGIVVGGPTK
jgi:hypothetical protein